MKRLSILIILISLSITVQAAFKKADRGTAGAKFLKIGTGTRAIGMGEAYTAVSDEVNAAYWNPAGLTKISRIEFTAMHNLWLAGFRHDYFGLAVPLRKNNQVLAVNVSNFTTSGFTNVETDEKIKPTDTSFGISYGRSIGFLRLGLTVKSIYQKLYSKSIKAFAGDAGLMYRSPTDSFGIGLAALNIGSGIDGDKLPLSIRLGSMVNISRKLILSADIHAPVDDAPNLHVGGEYTHAISKNLSGSFRTGFKNTSINDLGALSGLSLGAGVTWDTVKIDYAFVPYGDLGSTHRMSIGILFGSGKLGRAKVKTDYEKALALFKNNLYLDALKILQRYIDKPYLDQQAARLAKKVDRAIARSLSPDMLYSQAAMFYEIKKYRQSLDLLKEALALNPNHKKSKKLIKKLSRKLNLMKEEKQKKESLARKERQKQVVKSLLLTSRKQLAQGNNNEAVKTLEKLLRYEPGNKKAGWLIAEAQKKLDKKKQALEKKRAQQRKQKTQQARRNKTRADQLYQEGLDLYMQGKVDVAIHTWKKGLTLNPSHTKTINALKRYKKK